MRVQPWRGWGYKKIGKGCAARFPKPLPYLGPESAIFFTLFDALLKTLYPISCQNGGKMAKFDTLFIPIPG